jgi:AraC-like DNA-binding protein
MAEQTLRIKNMVCPRCVAAVEQVLKRLGYEVKNIELGKASVVHKRKLDLSQLQAALHKQGFELLFDRDQQIAEQTRVALIEYLGQLEQGTKPIKVSTFVSELLGIPYPALSRLFSQSRHQTITKHLIRLKVERAKELLSYGELTLSEIADRLKYSSVQHLSAQFRSVTGKSPSQYKGNPAHRHPLDAIA